MENNLRKEALRWIDAAIVVAGKIDFAFTLSVFHSRHSRVGCYTSAGILFLLLREAFPNHFPASTEVPSALPVRVTKPEATRANGWTARKRVTMSAATASPTNALALLSRMKTELPEIWDQAQVVGRWIWLEFTVPPLREVRAKLKELGFHWNGKRKCWQHPCGVPRFHSTGDPRSYYQVKPATDLELKDSPKPAKEFKVVTLRECPLPEQMKVCDTPDTAADYWRLHVASHPYFKPECECLVVLLLNTRRRVLGHELVTIGTLDTLLVHPREVFKVAVAISAAGVIIMHNHPSGDPTPSEADIKVTRDLIRAGQLMKIDVLDHVIMGNPNRSSLRELGYFYN